MAGARRSISGDEFRSDCGLDDEELRRRRAAGAAPGRCQHGRGSLKCGGQERPVIAIDTVWDAGRSVQTRPVLDGKESATWLDETLAGLGVDQAHLVGYSYRAWVALNQAVEAPTRVRTVTAIEPCGTITPLPVGAWIRMIGMLLGGERQHRGYLRWVRGGRLPDSTMLELLLSARSAFRQFGSPRPRLVSAEQWSELRMPLTVVLGGRSRLVAAAAAEEKLRREVPKAEVEVLSDASHVGPCLNPLEFRINV